MEGEANSRAQRAFTLVEMMVALLVLGILLLLAAPGFQRMIERYRVYRVQEELISGIYFARSEAIRIGGDVVLRGQGNTASWSEQGWIIFVDLNGNNILEPNAETVIQESGALSGVDVQYRPGHVGYLRINRWAQGNGAGMFRIDITPASGNIKERRCVVMASGGRLRGIRSGEGTCPMDP